MNGCFHRRMNFKHRNCCSENVSAFSVGKGWLLLSKTFLAMASFFVERSASVRKDNRRASGQEIRGGRAR